jgi:hypothetical protein
MQRTETAEALATGWIGEAGHPSGEELRSFLAGGLSRERVRQVVRHLLAGCARCSAEARKLWGPPEALLEPSRWRKERRHES